MKGNSKKTKAAHRNSLKRPLQNHGKGNFTLHHLFLLLSSPYITIRNPFSCFNKLKSILLSSQHILQRKSVALCGGTSMEECPEDFYPLLVPVPVVGGTM